MSSAFFRKLLCIPPSASFIVLGARAERLIPLTFIIACASEIFAFALSVSYPRYFLCDVTTSECPSSPRVGFFSLLIMLGFLFIITCIVATTVLTAKSYRLRFMRGSKVAAFASILLSLLALVTIAGASTPGAPVTPLASAVGGVSVGMSGQNITLTGAALGNNQIYDVYSLTCDRGVSDLALCRRHHLAELKTGVEDLVINADIIDSHNLIKIIHNSVPWAKIGTQTVKNQMVLSLSDGTWKIVE